MSLSHDYHVHSNYSDGRFLHQMVPAAAEAGLDAVGIADHCNVSERESMRRTKYRLGFNLDQSYERRRRAIEDVREETSIRVFDAVEMDYDPRDEDAIEKFLDRADFDYAVGSVHYLDGVNVHYESRFADTSVEERRALVDEYVEKLVALVDSELFEIVGHVDVVERSSLLRGLASRQHYERVADAFAVSRTVPEINAGRVLDEYGEFHPAPEFLDVLLDRDVDVVAGTDAHFPSEVRDRVPELSAFFDERGIDPVALFD